MDGQLNYRLQSPVTKIDQLIRRALEIKLTEQSVQILLNLFWHG